MRPGNRFARPRFTILVGLLALLAGCRAMRLGLGLDERESSWTDLVGPAQPRGWLLTGDTFAYEDLSGEAVVSGRRSRLESPLFGPIWRETRLDLWRVDARTGRDSVRLFRVDQGPFADWDGLTRPVVSPDSSRIAFLLWRVVRPPRPSYETTDFVADATAVVVDTMGTVRGTITGLRLSVGREPFAYGGRMIVGSSVPPQSVRTLHRMGDGLAWVGRTLFVPSRDGLHRLRLDGPATETTAPASLVAHLPWATAVAPRSETEAFVATTTGLVRVTAEGPAAEPWRRVRRQPVGGRHRIFRLVRHDSLIVFPEWTMLYSVAPTSGRIRLVSNLRSIIWLVDPLPGDSALVVTTRLWEDTRQRSVIWRVVPARPSASSRRERMDVRPDFASDDLTLVPGNRFALYHDVTLRRPALPYVLDLRSGNVVRLVH